MPPERNRGALPDCVVLANMLDPLGLLREQRDYTLASSWQAASAFSVVPRSSGVNVITHPHLRK